MRTQARIGLLQKSNQVVGASSPVLACQQELTVERFQLIANRIHRNIFAQSIPVVKGILSDLHRIGLVCLDPAQRIVPAVVALDDQRIQGADKETGMMKKQGNGLVVAAGMFHDDLDFTTKKLQLLRQIAESIKVMLNVEWSHDHIGFGSERSNRASTVGYIYSYRKHVESPLLYIAMAIHALPTADSNCLLTRVPSIWTQPTSIERCQWEDGWQTFRRALSSSRISSDHCPSIVQLRQ